MSIVIDPVDIAEKGIKKAFKEAIESFCFVAGTGVLTSDGLLPIEKIQIGDSVWAYNESRSEGNWKPGHSIFWMDFHEVLQIIIPCSTIEATYGQPLSNDSECVYDQGFTFEMELVYGRKILVHLARIYGLFQVPNLFFATLHSYLITAGSILNYRYPCIFSSSG
jgi:hypothetical protein